MLYNYRGTDVYYEDIGEGEPLVLLHGWGGSSKTIKCIAGALIDVRLILFDFPPFGSSAEPSDDWCLADYSDMTAECLRSLGINKASFAGHSFGGRVCIDIASRTDMAEKLILIDAAGLRPKRTLKKVISGMRFRRDKKCGRDVTKYYSPDYLALSSGMRKVFSRIVGEDLLPRLGKITCPTLIIWGEKDTETPLYMAKKLHKKIKGSGLIVMNGGHFAYLDNLRDVQLIIKSFIGN